MTEQQRQNLQECCVWAAKELREAADGFHMEFDKNGIEHLEEAMKYIRKLRRIIAASTQAP